MNKGLIETQKNKQKYFCYKFWNLYGIVFFGFTLGFVHQLGLK